ncbi:MAG: NHL repeat-containing protein [Bacteroidota bacterium]
MKTAQLRRIGFILGVVVLLLVAAALIYKRYFSLIALPEVELRPAKVLSGPEDNPHYLWYNPQSIATDGKGNLYICDMGNHRIVKYDSTLRYIMEIGRAGQGPGEFQYPIDVKIGKDGDIFVLDGGNRRIQVFDSTGKYLRSFPSTTVLARELVIDSKNNVYLMSPGDSKSLVTVFSPVGEKVGERGMKEPFPAGARQWQKSYIVRLATDADDNLYIQFGTFARLQKYDSDGKLIFDSDFSRVKNAHDYLTKEPQAGLVRTGGGKALRFMSVSPLVFFCRNKILLTAGDLTVFDKQSGEPTSILELKDAEGKPILGTFATGASDPSRIVSLDLVRNRVYIYYLPCHEYGE